MDLKKLSVSDKKFFSAFLKKRRHGLSCYAFENIYAWRGLYQIYWAQIDNCLCVFFKDKIGSFMYLPPLGDEVAADTIKEVFAVMDKDNTNPQVSRIENIEEQDIRFYSAYKLAAKPPEYVCLRSDLAQLQGNKYKHKRACCNNFAKNYKYECVQPYSPDMDEALSLHGLWEAQRRKTSEDPLYVGMLSDSRVCLETLLRDYAALDLKGMAIKVEGSLKALTFGFEINPETFCVMFETTDLSFRGLAQFVFREFCRSLSGYNHINIMDDSGLENLKAVKMSYHPYGTVNSYIASRGAA